MCEFIEVSWGHASSNSAQLATLMNAAAAVYTGFLWHDTLQLSAVTNALFVSAPRVGLWLVHENSSWELIGSPLVGERSYVFVFLFAAERVGHKTLPLQSSFAPTVGVRE